MKPWVSWLAAGWLLLWGGLGWAALGGAVLLVARPHFIHSRILNPGISAAAIAIPAVPAALCLWEGLVFCRRRAFTLFGEAATFANTTVWGLATALTQLGTTTGLSAQTATAVRTSCSTLFLLNLGSLACVWASRRCLERPQTS